MPTTAPTYHSHNPPQRSGSYLVIAEVGPGKYEVHREWWNARTTRWGCATPGPVLAWAEVPAVPASTAALRLITRLAAEGREPRDPVVAAAAISRAIREEACGNETAALVEASAAVEEYIDTTPWFHRAAVAATMLCRERGLETLRERQDREEAERLGLS